MQLQDKFFVVTGGGNGIGREVVLQLLREGARVAAVDLSEERLKETYELAGDNRNRLTNFPLNVADRDAVMGLVTDIDSSTGPIDGLINVAGIIQPFVKIVDLSFDDIERVMNVNFWGVVNMTKAFLPGLLTRPEAAVVNVSSMGGFLPVPGQAAYGASKAAVKLFTEALYAECRDTPVRVTVVFPGGVSTNITTNSGVAIPAMASGAKAPKTTTPEDAARQIIAGMTKGAFRVRIGSDARLMDRLARLAPRRATELIANQMKQLLG